MSDVITMDRDMLTEVMAQAMIRANEQRFGLPSRAAGEQSNIANRTEYYGLPLPTGNEVIAYQDFINDANNIIDGALHTLQNTLNTVSTTANNAADGVAAADSKISELVQANVDNEVSTLPQFKQDTENRLESLENDVMGLSGWSTKFKNIGSGSRAISVFTSSIGTITENYHVAESDWETITEPVKWWFGKGVNNQLSKKALRVNAEGNLYNLPEANTFYGLTTYGITSENSKELCGVFLKWTGVATELYVLSNTNKGLYVDAHMWPFTENGPVE